MNRNYLWRLILVLLVIAFSVLEMWPPTARNLIQTFRESGRNRDAAFNAIVAKAQELQKTAPDRAYENLVQAVGTNDLTHYFPQFEAKTEPHPNTFILNSLQRQAAGRIRLGLDLQ